MQKRLLFALPLASLIGCVPATWFNKIDSFHMSPRLEYQGFSFDRPPGIHWYLLQDEQSHTSATLRREIFSLSDTHTLYATIALGSIGREPESHEEFAELARSNGQQAPYDVRTVSYHQTLVTWQNQWCIRVESEHIATGAPQAPDRELTMILRGYRCLHPAWPKTTLDFFYSERGLADEIDPKLSEEGEAFLKGVRIDVAPGTPAV